MHVFHRPPMLYLASAAVTAALLSLSPMALAAEKTPPELYVQAQGSIDVAPDIATVNARLMERTPAVSREEGASTDPEVLAQARDRLEARVGELIRQIEAAGVERKDIRAGSLSVTAETLARPQDDGQSREPLIRTRLERPVSLTLYDLDSVPTILNALTAAGVDDLAGIQYDLIDRDAASDEALRRALARAQAKAQLMAESLGVSLGQVIRVEETQAPVFRPQVSVARAAGFAGAPEPEYREGEITLDAGVNVTWSID